MNRTKLILWNLCATVLLFLLVDYGYSNFVGHGGILYRIFPDEEKFFRIKHDVYHHTLAANVRVTYRWPPTGEHQICTDMHGFKSDCLQEHPSGSKFDLAFIGDSFAEANSMNYQDSFVGMFARTHPELRVANLGVVSYFPAIYLVKTKHLLDQGVRFDHLVVFIDVSDIYDETKYFIDAEGRVRVRNRSSRVRGWPRENFWLTLRGYLKIKQAVLPPLDPFTNIKGEWTYKDNRSHYGDMAVDDAISLAISHMESLHELLRAYDILLSVAVYPWPGQLKYDNLANSRQSQIWRDFCQGRCAMYIDAFPVFQEIVNSSSVESVYRDFYILGDIHFNKRGHELIFDILNNSYSTFKGNTL